MDMESALIAHDPAYKAIRCLGYELDGGNWFTSPRVVVKRKKTRFEVSVAAVRAALSVPLEEVPRLLASCEKSEKSENYHWGLILHEILEARLQGTPLDTYHPFSFQDEDEDEMVNMLL